MCTLSYWPDLPNIIVFKLERASESAGGLVKTGCRVSGSQQWFLIQEVWSGMWPEFPGDATASGPGTKYENHILRPCARGMTCSPYLKNEDFNTGFHHLGCLNIYSLKGKREMFIQKPLCVRCFHTWALLMLTTTWQVFLPSLLSEENGGIERSVHLLKFMKILGAHTETQPGLVWLQTYRPSRTFRPFLIPHSLHLCKGCLIELPEKEKARLSQGTHLSWLRGPPLSKFQMLHPSYADSLGFCLRYC